MNVKIPEWMDVPVIEEWQLTRMMDNLYYAGYVYREFPGLISLGFFFREDGIDLLEYSGRRFRVLKTLSKADLQWYRDVFFIHPHTVLQIPMKDKLLLVGFWADNLADLKKWIREQIPHADTSDLIARVFTRPIDMD